MKLINKPIKVICLCDEKGEIEPIKMKILDETGENKVVKIEKILVRNSEKKNGNIMKIFRCQSIVNNLELVFELKYEVCSCKWLLYKL